MGLPAAVRDLPAGSLILDAEDEEDVAAAARLAARQGRDVAIMRGERVEIRRAQAVEVGGEGEGQHGGSGARLLPMGTHYLVNPRVTSPETIRDNPQHTAEVIRLDDWRQAPALEAIAADDLTASEEEDERSAAWVQAVSRRLDAVTLHQVIALLRSRGFRQPT